jgi:hypothetical protein
MSVCAGIANASLWPAKACSAHLGAYTSDLVCVVWWSRLDKSILQSSMRKVDRHLPCCQHVVNMEAACIACRLLEHE